MHYSERFWLRNRYLKRHLLCMNPLLQLHQHSIHIQSSLDLHSAHLHHNDQERPEMRQSLSRAGAVMQKLPGKRQNTKCVTNQWTNRYKVCWTGVPVINCIHYDWKKLKFSYWINGTEIAGYIAKLLAFPFSLQKVGWDLRSLCWPMDLWTVGCFKIKWYIHFVDIHNFFACARRELVNNKKHERVIQSGQHEQRSKQCMQMSEHWANDSVPHSSSSYHFYSNREGWTR